MRSLILSCILVSIFAIGCDSNANSSPREADRELVEYLFLSEEVYTEYKDASRGHAERLLLDFLKINKRFLEIGTGDHARAYLGSIVLTKARIGLSRATLLGDRMELDNWLEDALPHYIEILGEDSEGRLPNELKSEILIWALALDLEDVPWLSEDIVASIGLTEELDEVKRIRGEEKGSAKRAKR